MELFSRVLLLTCVLCLFVARASWAQSLVAAVLPSSRSVQVGVPATVFATIINLGPGTATGCGISPITSLPATFVFQTTDPATNQVTGAANTPVDIPAGAAQSFVLALTPTAPFPPTDVQFSFDCTNSNPGPINSGLNTLLLSASSTPIPDIVALAATLNNDGIVNLASTGVFSLATVNVGASGTITTSADTGGVSLPASISICETNPATGQCVSAIGPSMTTQINANATPTFGIFVTGTGDVPFDPASNRIFVRFRDSGGVTRGSTSVAVRTQTAPDIRGTYVGSGSLTQASCQDPINNVTFGFSSTVNISSQEATNFIGTATLTTVVQGTNFVTIVNLSGTVATGGQLSGTFTFTTSAGQLFESSGSGTFTGSVTGNVVAINVSGTILVGETCTVTGSLSGTR